MPFAPKKPIQAIEKFTGFARPTSNTTYTPNQFFDVCLPHRSRGCVRLVALMLRQTLGWCDEEGDPQVARHLATYADFQQAGINRSMIRSVLKEAIDHHFIECVREPKQQRRGQEAVSGMYELKWDERPGYLKNPDEFRGFFAREGNRTYIPNQFFDVVVPREPLAVVKVVGSVIRFSIGFQNKWGYRRQKVSLSYQHIQNYSRMANRNTLSGAIEHALRSNYIRLVEKGYFDPNAGKTSKAAVYAVKWLYGEADFTHGWKNVPEKTEPPERSEIRTGNSLKNVPEERSEKRTDIEIKHRNKTYKEQTGQAAATFSRLKEAGFDEGASRAMASKHSFERVDRQIRWIDQRSIRRNRLGMLRRAIEEDWSRPGSSTLAREELGQPNSSAAADTFEKVIRNLQRRLSDSKS